MNDVAALGTDPFKVRVKEGFEAYEERFPVRQYGSFSNLHVISQLFIFHDLFLEETEAPGQEQHVSQPAILIGQQR
jgi:hypothetical protein